MCYIAGTADFDHYIQIMFIRQVSWNQVYLRNTKHTKIKHLQKAFSTNCVFSKNLYLYQKNNKTCRTRNEDSSDKNVWICFKLQENKVKVTKHRDLQKPAIHGDGPCETCRMNYETAKNSEIKGRQTVKQNL